MLRFQYNEWFKTGITKWGIFSAKSGYFYYAIHILCPPDKKFTIQVLYSEFEKANINQKLGLFVYINYFILDDAEYVKWP